MGRQQEYSGLKTARLSADLTIEEVSIITDITLEQINEYEINPSVTPASKAILMAKIYNTTVDQICFE